MSNVLTRREFLATATVGAAATAIPLSVVAQNSGNGTAAASAAPAAPAKTRAKKIIDKGPIGEVAEPAPYIQPSGERPLVIGSLDDLETQAAEVLSPGAFAFIAAGADNQVTLKANRKELDRIRLLPQYLVNKPAPDLTTTLLGEKLSMPIITAPMGAHGLAHESAEIGSAQGTGEAGTLYTMSTAANKTIEDVAAATTGPKWFQIYLHDDRGPSRELLKRAEDAGFTAIVFTIDAFAPGASDETVRRGFSFPPNLPLVHSETPFFKRSLGWDDLEFIQSATKLPIILKGVVSPKMATQAVERGVAAIQVSNHGGRGLDGVPAAITLLPPIVEAVNGRVPVIMDSGIRRGTDVFKALALGADAIALGRPILYGLSLGGAPGVKSVYDRIAGELERAMLIAGVASVDEINSDFLYEAATS